jgi:hypothetical protein
MPGSGPTRRTPARWQPRSPRRSRPERRCMRPQPVHECLPSQNRWRPNPPGHPSADSRVCGLPRSVWLSGVSSSRAHGAAQRSARQVPLPVWITCRPTSGPGLSSRNQGFSVAVCAAVNRCICGGTPSPRQVMRIQPPAVHSPGACSAASRSNCSAAARSGTWCTAPIRRLNSAGCPIHLPINSLRNPVAHIGLRSQIDDRPDHRRIRFLLPKPDTVAGQSPAHRSIRVALPRDDVQVVLALWTAYPQHGVKPGRTGGQFAALNPQQGGSGH